MASHHGQRYFADAVAALQAQQTGRYASDADLAALPHPTVVTISGADHVPFLEADRRAARARAVLDFLAG